jgi:hypothetical protein
MLVFGSWGDVQATPLAGLRRLRGAVGLISRGRSPERASPTVRCNAPCAEYPDARDNSESTVCQRRHWPAYSPLSAEAYVRAPAKADWLSCRLA